MDLPEVVVTHLRHLIASVGSDEDALVVSLSALTTDLRLAAGSYCGLRLALIQDGWPITLISFSGPDHEHPRASMRLPLSALDRSFSEDGSIVFYAEQPGAFVDLAADLSYALGLEPVTDGHRPSIALDHDLPAVSRESGLFGLTEYSAMNRAIGMLIDQGHAPTDAGLELRRRAASAGVEPHSYARYLLADPDWSDGD